MRCTGCENWTVQPIVMQHVPGGRTYTRLRVMNGIYLVGDYDHVWEVEQVVRREHVLEDMVDEPYTGNLPGGP